MSQDSLTNNCRGVNHVRIHGQEFSLKVLTLVAQSPTVFDFRVEGKDFFFNDQRQHRPRSSPTATMTKINSCMSISPGASHNSAESIAYSNPPNRKTDNSQPSTPPGESRARLITMPLPASDVLS